jgi:hypothetical protein
MSKSDSAHGVPRVISTRCLATGARVLVNRARGPVPATVLSVIDADSDRFTVTVATDHVTESITATGDHKWRLA